MSVKSLCGCGLSLMLYIKNRAKPSLKISDPSIRTRITFYLCMSINAYYYAVRSQVMIENHLPLYHM